MANDGGGARLVFTDAMGVPRTVPLGPQPVTLGRSRDNVVSFKGDDGVSRFHAEVVKDGAGFVVLDRGSAHGTFVNGAQIQEHRLVDGDSVQLGVGNAPSLRFVAATVVAPDPKDDEWADEPMTLVAPKDAVFANPTLMTQASFEADKLNVDLAGRLQALYTITSRVLSINTLEELCTEVLGMIFDVMPADRGAVLLLQDGELASRAVHTRVKGAEKEFRPSRTVASRSARENVAMLTLDASTDSRFSQGQSVMAQAIQSVVCAPISNRGNVFGVVYLDTTLHERAFAERDVDFLLGITRQMALAMEKLQLLDVQKKTFESTMRALAHSIDARDGITAGHSSRVAKYSQAIARHMGMSAPECRVIWYAGLLHDYGKIGTREAVLCKPDRLTPEEYEHIKEHPRHTFKILSSIYFAADMADLPRVASSHHERLDGKGYPFGWKGDEIPLGGRIIAVADFFDALTVKRHYREPAPLPEVIDMLQQGRDTQFDGGVLDGFMRYFEGEYVPNAQRMAERRAREPLSSPDEVRPASKTFSRP
jgi:HD-GYP domain-containing protein (c-di-GMP phosphodiesterase class II)